MNEFEVRDLFIAAAETDGRLPDVARPARLKAQSLPFVHSFEERRGWEPADMINGLPIVKNVRGREVPLTQNERLQIKAAAKDQLEYDDSGRQAIQSDNFWNGDRPTPRQVSEWEKAIDLTRLVARERNRRCLWAWARAQAKTLSVPEPVGVVVNMQRMHDKRVRPSVARETVMKRISFAKWCRDVEGIHRNYGKVCADHAIAEITLRLASNALQPNEESQNGTLLHGAEIRDIRVRLAQGDQNGHRLYENIGGWHVKDEKEAIHRFDGIIMALDPVAMAIKARREKDRKRRKAAA